MIDKDKDKDNDNEILLSNVANSCNLHAVPVHKSNELRSTESVVGHRWSISFFSARFSPNETTTDEMKPMECLSVSDAIKIVLVSENFCPRHIDKCRIRVRDVRRRRRRDRFVSSQFEIQVSYGSNIEGLFDLPHLQSIERTNERIISTINAWNWSVVNIAVNRK